MKQPDMKKNLILSTLYQVLTMLTPFITTPYISRVLGDEGVGVFSYTNSIQTYFAMFAALGTVIYGAREIARHRDDEKLRSRLFWEIQLLTVLTTGICLVLWGGFVALSGENQLYYLILTVNLVAVMLDISWFYTGLEQFQCIVAQNTVWKLLGIVALFVFVRDSGDVAPYIAVNVLTVLAANGSMWLYLPRYLTKVNARELRVLRHFKQTLVYFIPTIATSVYTVLDKTLIGAITRDNGQNGHYEQATKVVNLAKALTFTALNRVMEARISYLYEQKQFDEIKDRIRQSMDYILFMGIGILFGLVGVADRFVPAFFGEGWEPVVLLLQLMSPIVVIIGISDCLGSQYYTPAGLRGRSAKYLIAGAAANLVMNLCLIPFWGAVGAVIASVLAELLITWLYMHNCGGYLNWGQVAEQGWKKLVAGMVMLAAVLLLGKWIVPDIPAVIVQVVAGIGVYIAVLALLKDPFVGQMGKFLPFRKKN